MGDPKESYQDYVDGSPINWNLKQRIHLKEELPTLNDSNSVGQAVGRFLRDNKVWQQLKEEALAERQQCVPDLSTPFLSKFELLI